MVPRSCWDRRRIAATFFELTILGMRTPRPVPVIGSARIGGGLFVDAAQQLPIAEQVAGPHLADRQLAVATERVEREIGVKSNMAGKPGQPFFDEARWQVLAGEVIDDDDRPAGYAD